MEKNIPQDKAHDAVKKYYKSKYNKSIKPQRSLNKTNSFRSYKRKMNRKGVPRSFFVKSASKRRTGKKSVKSKNSKVKRKSKGKRKGKGKK